MAELAIVIVNWNSSSYLRACLESVVAEMRDLTLEIVVVDNASTRDDVDQIEFEFPSVRLIRNDVNVGFARANNLGFQHTRAGSVLFLNPDTQITGSALQIMLRVVSELEDAGIVGCRLVNSDLSVQTSSVLRFPRLLNQAIGTNFLYSCLPRLPLWGIAPLFNGSSHPVPVEAVSGACLMIRRDVFEAVGGFSEEYFMYGEDVDLCYKAARAGWRCYHAGSARVIHHGGGSSRLRSTSAWSAVVQCGAKLQFMTKTRGAAYGRLYRLLMAMSAFVRVFLLAGASLVRRSGQGSERFGGALRKWLAILRWSFNPETTVRTLTTDQENRAFKASSAEVHTVLHTKP